MLKRRWVQILLVLLVLGGVGWRYQSEIIGKAASWYLSGIAQREQQSGDLTQRRDIVTRTHRMLLMKAPPDSLVPELFDLTTALAGRTATGAISLNWSAYIYSSYYLDLTRERPTGSPARTPDQIAGEIDRYAAFYALQKRPDAGGVRITDLMNDDKDTISLEEIEQADREGRQIDIRR